MACRNPELARTARTSAPRCSRPRTAELDKVRAMVARGTLTGHAEIGVRVGKVLNKYKVAKHFELTIDDASFELRAAEDKVAAEAALDGLYVIRTGVRRPERMSADDSGAQLQALTAVERAFRSLKTIDLRSARSTIGCEDRVRAHIFLCMLAYYVEWHMREAWRELLFADEDQHAKRTARSGGPGPAIRGRRRKASTHRSTTAPLLTASAPCSKRSPPSCATPAAPGSLPSADLPDRHHPQPRPTTRPGPARYDQRVARSTTPGFDLHV